MGRLVDVLNTVAVVQKVCELGSLRIVKVILVDIDVSHDDEIILPNGKIFQKRGELSYKLMSGESILRGGWRSIYCDQKHRHVRSTEIKLSTFKAFKFLRGSLLDVYMTLSYNTKTTTTTISGH